MRSSPLLGLSLPNPEYTPKPEMHSHTVIEAVFFLGHGWMGSKELFPAYSSCLQEVDVNYWVLLELVGSQQWGQGLVNHSLRCTWGKATDSAATITSHPFLAPAGSVCVSAERGHRVFRVSWNSSNCQGNGETRRHRKKWKGYPRDKKAVEFHVWNPQGLLSGPVMWPLKYVVLNVLPLDQVDMLALVLSLQILERWMEV